MTMKHKFFSDVRVKEEGVVETAEKKDETQEVFVHVPRFYRSVPISRSIRHMRGDDVLTMKRLLWFDALIMNCHQAVPHSLHKKSRGF